MLPHVSVLIFLFLNNIPFMDIYISFINSSVEGHLVSFRFLAMNIHEQCFHFSWVYTRIGTAGLFDASMFNGLRSFQIIFQRGCTILHTHKNVRRFHFFILSSYLLCLVFLIKQS